MNTLLAFFVFLLSQGVEFTVQLTPHYPDYFTVECHTVEYSDHIAVLNDSVFVVVYTISNYGGKDTDIKNKLVPITESRAKRIIRQTPEAYLVSNTMMEFEVTAEGVKNR